ncbi:acetoacetyl-CoA reductase [Xylella fastidiosa subsp. morus]|jgi:acetoacetyl-CoA reductase|uniref:3-oxoacyl-[ACP] reductase n=6 Tax=Xylella fastidiosa TaxID=2371 RepID=Q87EP1_XYLFT|nr:acetoacetyl-CoA reductase [Xylella fastidiosa]ADN63255.1 3-ketoacyl-(acyl-carrier-protein) reductase [Xylella fastidiosa subsp. fastidiosa GB514]ERI60588.1 3-ketoacyl-ACP reductase [Xylella fastidiosa subsp. multiplex Griffin-1]KAF0571836.1 3-ketoacyl-ACP reductase [Xylella fastidiosa subsp. fastidiosa Mus-1]AAF83130.1 acetoacetyl-CoA reductase [Xylella fastidiosa 9a5c]AAO28148.1 3-oxoacyl-[ACP] reductase [Xylella fastidiosa Temecula1]
MTLRIAYVTSGMGSIGTAICQKLARNGHTVVAGCGPNSPRKANWLREQRELGFDFIASEGNAADWDSTVSAFAKVKAEVGEIDVLVNNAGNNRDMLFRQMGREDWNSVISSNLNSLFNITKQVIDAMTARNWGRIVNIGSVSAHKGQIGQVNYATAKAAMHGFTRALAQEVATRNVTVNTISPGYIASAAISSFPPDVLDRLANSVPMRRLGKAEEVAGLCAWLVSDEAAYVTGADYAVNGGLRME